MTDQDISAEAARIVDAARIPFSRATQAHAEIVALVKAVRKFKLDGTPRKTREERKPYAMSDAERQRRIARIQSVNASRWGRG